MSAHHAHILPKDLLDVTMPKPGPDGLPEDGLKRLVAGLRKAAVNWPLLSPHLAFDRDAYLRKRLFRDQEWEMLLLSWLPGHKTVIHDHGGSWACSLVIAGRIHESLYRWNGRGKAMDVLLERTVASPRMTVETRETIHKVENASSAPAVSIHFYSPPLNHLNSYDMANGQRHLVELETGPAVATGGRPRRLPRKATPKR